MIYLSLGSNMGDRLGYLKRAEKYLSDHSQISVLALSPVYETEPWPDLNQEWFLNQVIAIQTTLTPFELLELCESIEKAMGREGKNANAPRPIDLDILLYGNETADAPNLKIPHSRMNERRFVLIPLLDIAPDLTEPVSGKKYRDILMGIKDNHSVTSFPSTA